MTDLIYTEKELVQSLRDYIKAEESKLAAVKRYIVNPMTPTQLKAMYLYSSVVLEYSFEVPVLYVGISTLIDFRAGFYILLCVLRF